MSKCDRHRKSFVNRCVWCGKQVCGLCIGREDRNKAYCVKCFGNLRGVQRTRLPTVGRKPLPFSGKRYVLKNGYLELEVN